jgi:hypothetical protein
VFSDGLPLPLVVILQHLSVRDRTDIVGLSIHCLRDVGGVRPSRRMTPSSLRLLLGGWRIVPCRCGASLPAFTVGQLSEAAARMSAQVQHSRTGRN